MNLLLLEENDFTAANQVTLIGRRLNHLLDIYKIQLGDTLKAGQINGKMGTAEVLEITPSSVKLKTNLTASPPTPLPVTMILALPRPKMLRRIFQTIATMGVKKLYLVNTWRVEKSYWQTPWLESSAIREQLVLGLEQGCDTTLPEVIIKKRFKPFLEDELPSIIKHSQAFVAHPGDGIPCPTALDTQITLAIGPEGGFIDYEVTRLVETGFQSISLGDRILRVETAIPVLLSKLFS
jgi:RsmE family RNA methyltransferase